MIIFPAIDLKNGRCVRLNQGDFDRLEVVNTDAILVAKDFESKGAEYIHMVDLDGALDGEMKNLGVIKDVVASVDVPIQVGGGIRSIRRIETLLGIGVKRVILGTSALKDKGFLKDAINTYGDAIAVGVDAKDGMVATSGWIEVSNVDYIEFSKELEGLGVKTIIFTDISKDGMLDGPNIDMLRKLKGEVDVDIIASGGITTMDDVVGLCNEDFYGAIIGKAIYKGRINLKEAIVKGK